MRVFCPAQETIEHRATFNFLYCKSANGKFTVQFKDGEKIPFNVNCYKKRLETTQSFYIINENNFELDIEMIVGFGDYGDNSTVISQDVRVVNSETEQLNVVCTPGENFPVINAAGQNLKIENASGKPLEIKQASETNFAICHKKYKVSIAPFEAVIGSDGTLNITQLTGCTTSRIQNVSSHNMRLYSANGFILAPMGVEELSLSEAFKIYGTAGDKVVVGGFN